MRVRCRRRMLLAGLVAVMVLAAAAAFSIRWARHWPVKHFAVVVPGTLYRSAQPNERDLSRLKERYHIRTVINLRGDSPGEPWADVENEYCRDNGIRIIHLRMGSERLTDEELSQIVQTVNDPQCQPVLVHCEHGKSRTGIVVAAYRVVAQGWSYEAALAESRRFKKDMNLGYATYLQELAAGLHWRPGTTTRAVGVGLPARYP